ncbi:MAG: hypothetical protein Q9180_007123, partial [Flavoplaca navasiana]
MVFSEVVWKPISRIKPFLPQILANLPPSRSPIASLSYVLWNIKVTGKCALMSDTAVGVDNYDDEESPFAQARDALYILSVMNQYSIKPKMPAQAGEKLLRIALLSRALRVQHMDSVPQPLIRRRKRLARSLRDRRKKGVIPVI